jgi:hypothetical protein
MGSAMNLLRAMLFVAYWLAPWVLNGAGVAVWAMCMPLVMCLVFVQNLKQI